MSRIGKIPVPIPSGVQISVQDHLLTIEGKQGRLTFEHRPEVTVTVDKDANEVVVGRETDDRQARAL
ncbi:MAG: 50S ribosomal protein L6, partial [Phycisphaeraceae bacterium]|nr:50S ribosomal protein L6 [Phycisphaeraceae bacterium]